MVRITMEDGGIIDIELNEEVAPITCENFKKLQYSFCVDPEAGVLGGRNTCPDIPYSIP